MWPFAVKNDRPETVRKFATPPVPTGSRSFGKETRDALAGQPGRSARRRGNPKPNPLFRSPAGPEPSGDGTAKGRPESLLEGTTAPASKGSPGEERTVGKPGSPGGEEPQDGQSPACRKDVHRESRRLAGWTPNGTVAGLPERRFGKWSPACRRDVSRMVAGSPEDVRQTDTELAPRKSEGMVRSLLRLSRIGPCWSLLPQNPIGNRPGSRDPGRNLRRGRWRHRPRFAFGRCAGQRCAGQRPHR